MEIKSDKKENNYVQNKCTSSRKKEKSIGR